MLLCGMTTLLTLNGIKPQVIASLPEPQRLVAIAYGQEDRIESFPGLHTTFPAALTPMVDAAKLVVESFTDWGAEMLVSPSNNIEFVSSQLKSGETTFPKDYNLHSDNLPDFFGQGPRCRTLRLLCVSSNPADFIDLTDDDYYEDVLNQHAYYHGARVYKPQLMEFARAANLVVKPQAWDIILFDGSTPHLPRGMDHEQRRILMHAWIEVRYPVGWRDRIVCGDVPRLKLPALA